MKVTSCENVYTYCTANIGYNLVDYRDDILCYASSTNIVLYSLQTRKVINELKGHSNEVTSVRFVDDNREYIVSASTDFNVIVWKRITGTQYELKYKLKHDNIVSIAEAIEYQDKLFVFASSRKVFRTWTDELPFHDHVEDTFIFDIKAYKNLVHFPGLIVLQANSKGEIRFQELDLNKKEYQPLMTFTGHTDWIRSIDLYESPENGQLFIASGAQDFSTRIYSISELIQDNDTNRILHKPTFTHKNKDFIAECVSILYTHDLSVTSVKWIKKPNGLVYLLTASLDKTIILWEEVESGGELTSSKVWQEMLRLGEIGGAQMGYNGCIVNKEANMIVAYNYLGDIEVWREGESIHEWKQTMSITGHQEEVTDLAWEPEGQYFVTCSKDKTTRLHSKVKNNDSWDEIARIQIHGYELKCLAFAGPVKLVSGAEEKVIRIFSATKYFIQSLKNISGIDLMQNRNLNDSDMAEYAVIPALGLSNSAVYQQQQNGIETNLEALKIEDSERPIEGGDDPTFVPKVLDQLPSEKELQQNTLWPEVNKLYGHGFDLFSMAVNSKQTLLASASKAQTAASCAVIIWDLKNCKILVKLVEHRLTVTQIKFSPDDRFLLTVSRDRTWNMWNMEENSDSFGQRVAFFNSKTGGHSRIIWDAAWLYDSRSFVTVGRDQKAIIWTIQDDSSFKPNDGVLTLHDPIQSVDILPESGCSVQQFVAVFGLENGKIEMHQFEDGKGWNVLCLFENHSHTKAINRVRFSPKVDEVDGHVTRALLGTCAADKNVKLFEIKFV